MSLIRCPECNRKVSNKALRCVRCGYPFKRIKVKCRQSNELKEIETTIKAIHEDLHKGELDEDSISLYVFKFGIISVLSIAFFCFFYAVIKNTLDNLSDNYMLCSTITTITVIIGVFMILIGILSNLERKFLKAKKVIRIMTIIVCFIICAYISTATISIIVFDMFIKNDILTRCMTYHMLFGIFGFVLSLMIQEVWNTKDKSFIYAFTALIWALVVGFLTNRK